MKSFAPIMMLLAPVLFAVMIGVPIALLLWFARQRDKRREKQRGFEVQADEQDMRNETRN